MNPNQLANLALAGLLGTGMIACSNKQSEATESSAKEKAKNGSAIKDAQAQNTAEIKNICRGNNECKGLGGCKMTQAQIEEYAKKAGVEPKGQPHMCAGLNECKGLGGCKVTMKKYAELKAKLENGEPVMKSGNGCGGKNGCGGANGCPGQTN